MERRLDQEMRSLLEELFSTAQIVKQMLRDCVRSLVTRDEQLAHETVERDQSVNQREIEIEERAIDLIARYQPVASDLRTLTMVIKINKDLERIGDHCQNIAIRARRLAREGRPPVKPYVDIPRMQEIALKMLEDALLAFLRKDSGLALQVCARDDEVDHLRDQVIRELLTIMMSNPSVIDIALAEILNAKDLERIADLATNIAEDVYFVLEGRSIAHSFGREPGHEA